MVPSRNLFTCFLSCLDMEAKPAGAVFGGIGDGDFHRPVNADLLKQMRSPFNMLLGADTQPNAAASRHWLRAGQRQR
jgi:hypothetical protein